MFYSGNKERGASDMARLQQGSIKRVLFLNEPDGTNSAAQANIAVTAATKMYNQLPASLNVIGPAMAHVMGADEVSAALMTPAMLNHKTKFGTVNKPGWLPQFVQSTCSSARSPPRATAFHWVRASHEPSVLALAATICLSICLFLSLARTPRTPLLYQVFPLIL